jgi:hypothetical protein
MPKTLGMSAAAAESLSPELVLVCPELREHALGDLERLVPRWAVIRAAVEAASDEPASHEAASHEAADEPLAFGASILPLARFGAAAMVSATAITLSLTLIADAIR